MARPYQSPFSERQGQKRDVDPNRKAEDPTTKKGIVGAFCRVYDVPAAIEKFLPDVYAPGDAGSGKARYTFLGGTTSNGAVVEDGGLFLYSYHTSDPCSDMLVNAFDMVRRHLFGHLDEGSRPDLSPSARPSYKAMVGHVRDDPLVVAEYAGVPKQYEFDDLDAGPDGEPTPNPEAELVDENPAMTALHELLGLTPDTPQKPKKKEPVSMLDQMNHEHAVAFIAGKAVVLTFKR